MTTNLYNGIYRSPGLLEASRNIPKVLEHSRAFQACPLC